jgi:hypothetical protein
MTDNRKFHFEARPSSGKGTPWRTWKLVRVVDPCPCCGAGEPSVEILAYAYAPLSDATQESLMKAIADALNDRSEPTP